MPRFYFHIFDDSVSLDDEGTDLPDLAAARDHPIHGARDLLCATIMSGILNLNHFIRVTDDVGDTVMTLPFREAVEIAGP